MQILLVTPPLTQLNTPYPASPYLAGYLEKCGYVVAQLDLGIQLVDRIFTRSFLHSIFDDVLSVGLNIDNEINGNMSSHVISEPQRKVIACRSRYEDTVEAVIHFLRGQNPLLSQRICTRGYLPEGSRFESVNELEWAFGEIGIHDKAVHLATLYIEDIADFIRENVTPNFELIKYAEKLCMYLPEFDPLIVELERAQVNRVDQMMLSFFEEVVLKVNPQVVGFCVPFPGNLYGALKCGALLKEKYPSVLTVVGGGYVNTELRQLTDARLFDYLDFLTFDDGELPLERLLKGFLKADYSIDQLKGTALEQVNGTALEQVDVLDVKVEENAYSLIRTMFRYKDKLQVIQLDSVQNIPMADRGVPDYSGLALSLYMDMTEVANPMLRLWSNGRWNKLTLAHGCYWAKCAFCDTSLDYISRYETVSATVLVDRMEAIMHQTGQSGFHFVDEAAPPSVLKRVALEIISRGLQVSWWGNIRFEKSFTPDLCKLLAKSGCIAVSGGIEVASDRLLLLMNKGVTLFGAANTCDIFTKAGIMVHAYLMYGFPTQTTQETVDSLEVVRQFFDLGLIQSAFWHRFAMTVHSPVGACSERFGVKRVTEQSNPFANNEASFTDPVSTDHDQFGEGLRTATFNYMRGVGFDKKAFWWFDTKMPKTTYPPTLVESFLVTNRDAISLKSSNVIWLGDGLSEVSRKTKAGKEEVVLTCYSAGKVKEIVTDQKQARFAFALIEKVNPATNPFTLGEAEDLFTEITGAASEKMVKSIVWKGLGKMGLVVV